MPSARALRRRRGEIMREGVSVAIVGPPNVGKSSILNALSKRDVAITSSVAGTTRDVIEVRLDLSDGRGRIDAESDFYAERFYFPEQLRDAFAKFNVNDDLVCAGFGEGFQQDFRF